MSEIPEQWYGHGAQPREVITYLCDAPACNRKLEKQADGTFRHAPRDDGWLGSRRDTHLWYKEREKAAAEARVAEAMPYEGAIKQCQAGVTPAGRAMLPQRCRKTKPLFVVSREPYWGGKITSTSPTIDRIVVCKTHAGDARCHRHHEHRWTSDNDQKMSGDALELVEQEYR